MKKYLLMALVVLALCGVAYFASFGAKQEKVASQSDSGNIKVLNPAQNEKIGNPVLISGEARVFENAFNYRLLDGNGGQIAGGFNFAKAEDVGLYGPFSLLLSYQKPTTKNGTLEVYTHSAMDGSEIDVVSIPVRF
jgi:hypothetical protein